MRSPRTSPRGSSPTTLLTVRFPIPLSLGHLGTSSRTQLAVAREVAKQVYVGEKLAPPSWAQASYTCTFRILPLLQRKGKKATDPRSLLFRSSLSASPRRPRRAKFHALYKTSATQNPPPPTIPRRPPSLRETCWLLFSSLSHARRLAAIKTTPCASSSWKRPKTVRQFAQQAPHVSFWRKLYESGEYKRWLLYAVEAYGIFKIGEMVGRRHIVGYKLDESRTHALT